jgi:hypothetical protein
VLLFTAGAVTSAPVGVSIRDYLFPAYFAGRSNLMITPQILKTYGSFPTLLSLLPT